MIGIQNVTQAPKNDVLHSWGYGHHQLRNYRANMSQMDRQRHLLIGSGVNAFLMASGQKYKGNVSKMKSSVGFTNNWESITKIHTK